MQLPMARGSLVLAANQGLLYVLSMAVIGGMVGAGALGYDVVLGFSRSEEWGKGAAAGSASCCSGSWSTASAGPPRPAGRHPRPHQATALARGHRPLRTPRLGTTNRSLTRRRR